METKYEYEFILISSDNKESENVIWYDCKLDQIEKIATEFIDLSGKYKHISIKQWDLEYEEFTNEFDLHQELPHRNAEEIRLKLINKIKELNAGSINDIYYQS